ncbi:hypothetical protein ACFP3U_36035 [Kitasatospora misakiensis]|uniref:Integral membrane protein n=1 Tax=Kitasatospora misakiensis TaxID=67330 RepID=A0ABW0XES3_9ACTN
MRQQRRQRRIVAGLRARGLAVRGRVWAATSGSRPGTLPVLGLLPPVLLAAGLSAEAAPLLWPLIAGWLLVLGCAGMLLRRPAGGDGRTRAGRTRAVRRAATRRSGR